MEGLLKDKKLLSEDHIVAPELVLYEVANSVWKHEYLIKDLKNGEEYLTIFYGLIKAGQITVVSASEVLTQEGYTVAKENGITIYDALFVCLAIKLGLTLKTFDKVQERTFKSENRKVRSSFA